jgi:alpha-L-fucosidase
VSGPGRREVLGGGAALGLLPAAARAAPAGFEGTWESLASGYRCPDWFRDAKLGLWAHWGPQCVPEYGDWYGRQMYQQGNPFYAHYLKTYGHPADVGFMEIIGRWKAENWDPQDLISRFKQAGARYFMAMAQHHDNFDCFASSHHAWNSVKVGPRRDILGVWARLARREGLKFGVSNHGSHAWHWWQTAYGYDAEGPRRGERYDAFRLRKADGAGKWWAGLDPQELYTGPSFVPPDGIASIKDLNAWHDANSGQWLETPPPNNPAFARNWALRCREVIDKYRPDILYFDNYEMPLGRTGLEATAYLYNRSLAWNGGREMSIVTTKKLNAAQRRAVMEDVERGFSDRMRDEPWQTDTCLGDWHYNRARLEHHSYVPAKAVIQRLWDVVSKNGNLLLSVPMRGDGSIDADERKILTDMSAWISVGGEAIYGSRPWKIYGEGPTRPAAGMQNEGAAKPFTAADVRFSTRAGRLYAAALDWPTDGVVRVESLADGSRLAPGPIERVDLVGAGELAFRRTGKALEVTLPDQRPTAFVPVLRIAGAGLV